MTPQARNSIVRFWLPQSQSLVAPLQRRNLSIVSLAAHYRCLSEPEARIGGLEYLGLWLDLSVRCAEVQQVMILRTMKILAGGAAGKREARRMVSEKAAAAAETMVNAALGEKPERLVRAYRSKVRANHRRLSKGGRR